MTIAGAPSLREGKVDLPLAAEETEGIDSPGLWEGTIDKVWVYGSRFQTPLSLPSSFQEGSH
jgi:hypothetical protein